MMLMKVNTDKLKKLRNARFWSQEELAIACGLGLRTVQRVESSGTCSLDTLKALAAVFEVSADALLLSGESGVFDAVAGDYLNVQLGYTILAVLFTTVGVCVWQFSRGGMAVQPFVASVVVLTVISSLFGSLTVNIKDTALTWYFGVGFWKKRVELGRIQHVRTVRNKGWWGWGIRHYGPGWLYNVSGLHAVEVRLDNGDRFRLGTDEPESLAQSLRAQLEPK